MSSDPEWRYLNVRRLFNFVETSILSGTNWVVFEPNDPKLWDSVKHDESEQFLSLDEVERLHIQRILAATGNNLSRGAEILGVTRSTLYNKMRKYGILPGK